MSRSATASCLFLAALLTWPALTRASEGEAQTTERLYTYRDDSGMVHIVSKPEQVPEAYRELAVPHSFVPRAEPVGGAMPERSPSGGDTFGMKRILDERREAIDHQSRRVRELEVEIRRQAQEEERRRELARRERMEIGKKIAAKSGKKRSKKKK